MSRQLSSQKYEEGEKALLEARKVESEHQARLRSMQLQMEQLKQQEEYLHQVHLFKMFLAYIIPFPKAVPVLGSLCSTILSASESGWSV